MEESGFHPNWRALTTVHFPYKIFLSEGSSNSISQPASTRGLQHKIHNISGEEAQKFYENTICTTPTLNHVNIKDTAPKYQPKQGNSVSKIDFDKNKFFRAAMANDVKTLQMFQYKNGDVDSMDKFGWTALMMAACEGSLDSFSYLLKLGADLNKCDKKGNSAVSLAKLKGYNKIIDALPKAGIQLESDHKVREDIQKLSPFYCEICKFIFKETTLKGHETSTVHRFNVKSLRKSTIKRFNVSESNRGLKLMLKQGWDRNSGLGPTNSGQLFPVKTVIRKGRTGLGIKQSEPRVTHFKAYDLAAIKYKPQPRDLTRKELERNQHRKNLKERYYRRELNLN